MKRAVIISALFAAGLVGGFELEHWKVAVNYILEHQDHIPDWDSMTPPDRAAHIQATRLDLQYDYYYGHLPITFLFQLKLHHLSLMKWVLTGAGMVFFFVMIAAILQQLFPDLGMLKWVAMGFGGVCILSAIAFIFFRMLGKSAEGYAITRKLLGALQSFVPLMLYIPAAILLGQSNRMNHHEHDSSKI